MRSFILFYYYSNTKVWRAKWKWLARRTFVPMPWKRPWEKACWLTLFDFIKVAVQCHTGACTATTCFVFWQWIRWCRCPLVSPTTPINTTPFSMKSPTPNLFSTSPPRPDQIRTVSQWDWLTSPRLQKRKGLWTWRNRWYLTDCELRGLTILKANWFHTFSDAGKHLDQERSGSGATSHNLDFILTMKSLW